MLDKLLVSIGMPVYNGERYIRRALDSLLAQDYKNFELIISDNASEDATQEICLDCAATDRRIRFYRNEKNMGAVWNFNRVFKLSNGKYFMWAGDHDLWDKTFISQCVEILEREPSVVLCYSQALWMDLNGKLLETIPTRLDTRGLDWISRFHVVLWGIGYAYQIYGLIRSSALSQTYLHRNTIGADVILLSELSLLGEFAYVPEPLFHVRKLADFGSWNKLVEKLFVNKPLTRWAVYSLIWRRFYKQVRIAVRHSNTLLARIVLMLSISTWILAKYRGRIRGLLKASRK
ncbi:glycosyltransferase family 2 protein [Desulfohalobiaceae bacterium Ax17]|uniref:glycosyltransferase family A protein n=1 Tax=Desulfovulcanus ferrireducens TaxID=2831190 RepID=UPI00207BC283|nr:glycosyltransferase family 2 protein [Desulfovulcanus ferrireducens]MBT8763359.1 glycosyltransferase family 2 protein [Desulfovulcanus ferrireducens]